MANLENSFSMNFESGLLIRSVLIFPEKHRKYAIKQVYSLDNELGRP